MNGETVPNEIGRWSLNCVTSRKQPLWGKQQKEINSLKDYKITGTRAKQLSTTTYNAFECLILTNTKCTIYGACRILKNVLKIHVV